MIRSEFKFHSVGQGLFYSGRIWDDKDESRCFSFIYDCGARPYIKSLNREVLSLKKELEKAGDCTINLLVLSHLHDDHVNGVKKLVKEFKIENVVLPYLSSNLKKIPLVESRSKSKVLRSFYMNPEEWLLGHGVKRIFLLSGNDVTESNYKVSRDFELSFGQCKSINQDYINNDKCFISYQRLDLTIGDIWKMEFECLPLDDVSRYIKIFEHYLDGLSIQELLSDKEKLKCIKRKLREEFWCKDYINRTSVVLKHGPCNVLDTATLLTGDIILKDNETFGFQNTGYRVLQYPHHGSDGNNMDYFKKLTSQAYVVSYKTNNQYGHPGSKVKETFKEKLITVTEKDNGYVYYI